jgi:hypothetical protein
MALLETKQFKRKGAEAELSYLKSGTGESKPADTRRVGIWSE